MEKQKIKSKLKERVVNSQKLDHIIGYPVETTVMVIGKKYSFPILRNIMAFNHTRFSQFLSSIKKLTPTILSSRLQDLEKEGLIKRTVYSEKPVRVEYHLTAKGKALKPILKELTAFSIKFYSKGITKKTKPKNMMIK